MPIKPVASNDPFRSWLTAVALALAAVLLSACFEYEQVVTVGADGSGSIRESSFIKGPAAAMMRSMDEQEKSEDGSLEVSTGVDTEQTARDRAGSFGEGVRFVSWERISEDEREGTIAVYEFDDVTALRLGTGPPDMEEPGAMESEDEVEGEGDTEGIGFRFERQGAKRVLVAAFDFEGQDEPEEASEATSEGEEGDPMGEMMDDMAQGMTEMMKPMLEGMRMRTVVEIDGEVLESDAPVDEGSRVVLMDMDFDTLMADEEGEAKFNALGADPSMGEVREALAGMPGITFPATDEVRIVFR